MTQYFEKITKQSNSRCGINISFRNYVFFALVNSNMAKFLAKRWWSQEDIPTLRGSQFTSSAPSGNSRPFWLDEPQSCSVQKIGKYTKLQYIGVIWGLLKAKVCSSIKHDPTQSLFWTHNLRLVLRKWYTWKLERIHTEKNCTVKNVSTSWVTAKNCTQAEFALWTPGF